MKKCHLLLGTAVMVFTLLLTNCTDQNDGILRIHKYINHSGVQVAMVGDAYGNIPDSLVIPNGETYECSLHYPLMDYEYDLIYPYNFGIPNDESTFIPLKVYYNKDICVSYTYRDKGKTPVGINRGSYEIDSKVSKKLNTLIYTYTFTPEDYQNAINSQK